MSFCAQCGSANADDARFCEKCGHSVAPTSGAAASKPDASEKTKAAAARAASAVRRVNPLLMVGLGVLLLALVAGVVLLRPMDSREYRREARVQADDLADGVSEIEGAIYELAYDYEDEGDDLDESAIEDARKALDEESVAIKKAAARIERLRPPSEYKSADEDLREWARFYSEDWLRGFGEAISQSESGMTYEEFMELLNDVYEDQSDGADDAFDALMDAEDELRLGLQGE